MKETVHEHGVGTQILYKVEVRHNTDSPLTIPLENGKVFVLDKTWRTLPILWDGVGRNIPSGYNERVAKAHYLGVVSYNSAQAHRFLFLAGLDAISMGTFCVETRLVRVQLDYSFKVTEHGVSPVLDFLSGNGPEDFTPKNTVEEIP